MLDRLLPRPDKRYDGHRAALWLLGLYVGVKLAMSLNSIFNTAKVAGGADGIPLATFGPAAVREVLTLFALVALGQLALAFPALTVLIRYRALVPLMFALLLAEAFARRAIVFAFAAERVSSTALYINIGLIALLAIGLVLALIPARPAGDT